MQLSLQRWVDVPLIRNQRVAFIYVIKCIRLQYSSEWYNNIVLLIMKPECKTYSEYVYVLMSTQSIHVKYSSNVC